MAWRRRNLGKPDCSAFERIVRLVDVKDRAVFQMKTRLAEEGYDDDEILEAIAQAVDYGILDDSRYGSLLIQSRYNSGYGLAGIFRELERLDISIDDIEYFPEGFSTDNYESEVERAVSLLEKKNPQGKNAKEKAYQTLIRKGYASSVSSSASRIWYDKIHSVE